MKVFITIEIEKEDLGKGMVSEEAYTHLMKTIEMLRLEGIPVQYKDTNLPRRKGWVKGTELDNIEKTS